MKEEEKDLIMKKAARVNAGIDEKRLEALAQKLNDLEKILIVSFYPPKDRSGLRIAQEAFERLFKDKEKMDALAALNSSLKDKFNILISLNEKINSLLK